MAQNILLLMQVMAIFPMGSMLGLGFYFYLLAWYRRSELSADRAAILATQSKDLVVRTMMKLAGGGSTRIYESMSQESFLEQAEEYEELQREMMESEGNKKWAYIFGTFLAASTATHPWPALRTKEAVKFYDGERYQTIISQNSPTKIEEAAGVFASEGLSVDVDMSDLKEDVKKMADKATGYGKVMFGRFKDKLKDAAEQVERESK